MPALLSQLALVSLRKTQLIWKTIWQYLLNLILYINYDPANAISAYIHQNACTKMFTAGLFLIAENWK